MAFKNTPLPFKKKSTAKNFSKNFLSFLANDYLKSPSGISVFGKLQLWTFHQQASYQ